MMASLTPAICPRDPGPVGAARPDGGEVEAEDSQLDSLQLTIDEDVVTSLPNSVRSRPTAAIRWHRRSRGIWSGSGIRR